MFFKKGVQAYNFIKKEILAHVFFCEFCEIFKNTFFTEHLWMTASVNSSETCWLKRLIKETKQHKKTVPYLTELPFLLLRVSALRKLYAKFLKLKTASMITGFKPFFVLKISVASICRFL